MLRLIIDRAKGGGDDLAGGLSLCIYIPSSNNSQEKKKKKNTRCNNDFSFFCFFFPQPAAVVSLFGGSPSFVTDRHHTV